MEIGRNLALDHLSTPVDLVVYGEFADEAAFARYRANSAYAASIAIAYPLRELRFVPDFHACVARGAGDDPAFSYVRRGRAPRQGTYPGISPKLLTLTCVRFVAGRLAVKQEGMGEPAMISFTVARRDRRSEGG